MYQAKLACRTSQIVGVLWHQGESDCAEHLYSTYQQRFETMMNQLRIQLDLKDVTFILGGLGDFLKDCTIDENLKNYTYINHALIRIAQENTMTGFVTAEGLTANPDNLHFSADSLYRFGIRYFEEYDKISRHVHPCETDIASHTTRSEMELL